jgi:hypothetical protein
MQCAAEQARRTIVVLSPDYLQALHTQPEWAAAFAQDPTGEKRILLPVRVRECGLKGLLSQIVYIDLVDLAEEEAMKMLLDGVKRDRAKPTIAPRFPEAVEHIISEQPSYPGILSERTDPGDACHHRLDNLSDELERELKHPHTAEHGKPIQGIMPEDDEYRASIESPYGTMPPDSKFYIEREADSQCWRYLTQLGPSTVFVQAPRQMGKSSLMRRMAYQLEQTHGIKTAYVDFQEFPEELFENEREFLVELCIAVLGRPSPYK